jgi:exodeoxyribonuclease VII small subunit
MPDPAATEYSDSFEAALSGLQQIVSQLEEGNLGLEASLARYEEGVSLLKTCYRILEQAEQRIEIVTGADKQGQPVTTPFAAEATFEPAEKPARRAARRKATQTEPQPERPPGASPPEEPRGERLF